MPAFQSTSHAMRCTDASIVTDGIQRNELGRIADSKGLQASKVLQCDTRNRQQ